MKQAVQDLRGGGTRIVETPIPTAGRGQVVVRTACSLLSSGTERMVAEFAERSLVGKARARPDLVRQTLDKARREGVAAAIEAVRTRLSEPMALGYASAGTVVEVGEGVDDLLPGDRVACAGGGYAVHAEYAAVPRILTARLPDSVGFDAGAFATLGAIALHGFRLAEVQVGERVGVIGLGLIGLLAVAIGRSAGAEVFGVDLAPQRAGLADAFGGTGFVRDGAEAALANATGGRGVDAVLICADTASNDPVDLAAAIARDRARVVAIGAVGMTLPRSAYYEKELTLIVSRSYGPGRYDPDYEEGGRDYPAGYVRWTEGRNLQAFVDLLGQGSIDVSPLITDRVPLEHAAEAYRRIRAGAESGSLAVLLEYASGEAEAAGAGRTIAVGRPPAQPGPVRIGLLGAGRFAQDVVLPILRRMPEVSRIGVASARGLSAAEAARRFGFVYAASDESRVIEDPEINTVVVLTRHHLHAAQTAAALQAGKHVWCEKPLAIDRQGLEKVRRALAGSAGQLTVGFNRRFAPLTRELRSFLGEVPGPLTMVYRVNAGPLPPGHWLRDLDQGGGRLLGEVCHFIDYLTMLSGGGPRRVAARGSGGDDLLVTLEFPGGSLGTIVYAAHGDRAFGKERLEVFAPGKVAVVDDFRSLELVSGGRRRTVRRRGRLDKGHAAHWGAFVRAIRVGGPPPIPIADLLTVTEATLAAADSLRRGEAVDLASTTAAA